MKDLLIYYDADLWEVLWILSQKGISHTSIRRELMKEGVTWKRGRSFGGKLTEWSVRDGKRHGYEVWYNSNGDRFLRRSWVYGSRQKIVLYATDVSPGWK